MRITRDDLKWTIGMIAAVIVGLATLGNTITDVGVPISWLPYIRLVALIVGIVSGKMATSPLRGEHDTPPDGRITPSTLDKIAKSIPLLFLTATLGSMLACATARHVVVAADVTFAQSVFAIDDAERSACQAHVLSADQCQRFNGAILTALKDVQAVTESLRATPPAVAVPSSLPDLIADLATLQRMAAPLSNTGALGTRINTALAKAAQLLSSFAGGK